MKTAVSIPDDVFHNSDLLAKQLKWSRSKLYTEALRHFVRLQQHDPVTEQLNALVDELANEPTPNVGRQLIESGQWEW